MQKILRLTIALLILFSGNSYAFINLLGICPYAGIDIQRRHVSFPTNNGANVFKKNSRQANLYIGTKLTPFMGVEFGYETTAKASRITTLNGGEFITGTQVGENAFADFNSGTRFYGWHLDAMGYFPLSSCYPVELVGSLGVINLKAKLVTHFIQDPTGPVTYYPARNFVQSRPMLRALAGLQYTFMNCLGIRASVAWEQANRFRYILAREGVENADRFVRIKNSVIYGLGAYVFF